MPAMTKREKFLIFLGLLFFLLLNYPLLEIVNGEVLVGRLPLLGWYLFGVWFLAIAALHVFSRRLKAQEPPGQKEPKGNA